MVTATKATTSHTNSQTDPRSQLEAVQRLHHPVLRYQHDPEAGSYESAEEAIEAGSDRYVQLSLADITYFVVCAECGPIEMAEEQVPDIGWEYCAALWPCRTAKTWGAPEPTAYFRRADNDAPIRW